MRHWITTVAFATLVTLLLQSCPASGQANVKNDVAKVAAAFQMGNAMQAQKLAAAAAQNVEEIADLMGSFRPKGNATDGNLVAAVAEIALAKPPARPADKKKWLALATELRDAGLALAAAKGAQQANATARVGMACKTCHATFKD